MIVLKNTSEIKRMSTACKISAQALKLAGDYMKPGISTKEIDNEIHKFILSTGAKPNFLGYGGFPGSACISVNNVVIHGIPSKDIILKDVDIVSVDVGELAYSFGKYFEAKNQTVLLSFYVYWKYRPVMGDAPKRA